VRGHEMKWVENSEDVAFLRKKEWVKAKGKRREM
jgi:hypothetical protein